LHDRVVYRHAAPDLAAVADRRHRRIGFAFDSYELLMLPLIARPALSDLLHVAPTSPAINDWPDPLLRARRRRGIFGLLGGVPDGSPRPPAACSCGASCSTRSRHLLRLRDDGPVAPVLALLYVRRRLRRIRRGGWGGSRELFRTRSSVRRSSATRQTVGSIGGIMATAGYYLVVTYGHLLPPCTVDTEAWRYTLMSGVGPSDPLIVVRPFPTRVAHVAAEEASPVRSSVRASASCSSPIPHDDDRDDVMMAAAYAAAFRRDSADAAHRAGFWPEVRTLPPGDRAKRSARCSRSRNWADWQGGFCLAFFAVRIVSRRRLLHIFQSAGPRAGAARLRRRGDQHLEMLEWAFSSTGREIGQFSFWETIYRACFPRTWRKRARASRRTWATHVRHVRGAAHDRSWPIVMPGPSAPRKARIRVGGGRTGALPAGLVASVWLPEPKRGRVAD